MFHVERNSRAMNYLPLGFLDNAKAHGLCTQYAEKIASARTKKALVDIALGANGVEWMAQSIAEGWGLDPHFITEHFAAFNNARYVWRRGVLSSAMYVFPQFREIKISTTQALLVGFEGVVRIPENRMSALYCVDCDFNVEGGTAYAKTYNSRVGGNAKLR